MHSCTLAHLEKSHMPIVINEVQCEEISDYLNKDDCRYYPNHYFIDLWYEILRIYSTFAEDQIWTKPVRHMIHIDANDESDANIFERRTLILSLKSKYN